MSVAMLPSLNNLSDAEVQSILREYSLGLTVEEAQIIEVKILKRPMTVAEAVAWSIQGSEHCSYKSSRAHLKQLPTEGRHVILGPGEDSGIVAIAEHEGERYGIVMAHESHNHPSQVVPYEGAATGIGGIVRDVVCMGAKVIATADPLRFGNINEHHTRWIAAGVRAGIGGYGNPIGVPNLAGDVYWTDRFSDNCLVNVVALGLVKESDIIHSHAPADAVKHGCVYILVGKPTDNSGFGGASLASDTLREVEKEHNKGAVQEPNAFLKRHLLESTYELFRILKEKKLIDKVGFKDLGAGGILCASAEMTDAAGCGAEINVDAIPVSMEHLPPEVVLCAETQERFAWIVPPDLAPLVLAHYNERWALPEVSLGARAAIIGNITGENYVARQNGEVVVDARAQDLCRGLKYDRPYAPKKIEYREPMLPEPNDYNEILKQMLAHENVASRAPFYERYDKNVQGQTIIEAGRADAGVLAPFLNEGAPQDIKKTGIALSVDGNPLYARISPYWGAANAVAESMRNVAAVGAVPWALTDCLNYGNPEKKEQMWEFVEGVRGIADAAKQIHLKGYADEPVPVISGNVSLYNESPRGSIDPSAIIACLGRLENYEKAITMEFKKPNSEIFMLGARKDELGGSVYYQIAHRHPEPSGASPERSEGSLGTNVPQPDFDEVGRQIYAITDMIDQGLLLSCHDISDGGLAVALAEMCFGGGGDNRIGIDVDLSIVGVIHELPLPSWKKLFSETGGFVFETTHADKMEKICAQYSLKPIKLGATTTEPAFQITDNGNAIIDEPVATLAERWVNGLREKIER
ncbi:phosphoribosylformylglycinamidine synthase II [Candidatus Uhrbacteria bacterium RIFCSPHIGHO2_12_FULL_54_23]|uniref:Phosphoribosylformylglycinamidine synthase subunit PurL n=1 Tax=Candidatus Uhrbacteria bacterium RIFCSPHIGHO2_12_FULL_54_23 TaxID=1802397 RepID=A0A1F7UIZ2_9BACT|nr:MAG: phosphoribosylformylglycinamidine synthase II [Candidatus Uhrbacteria bacterium RIFCSPHIGHO2_12_FULL_54_23]